MIIHHNCKKCGSLHIYSEPLSVYYCNSCSYFNQIEQPKKCNHNYKIINNDLDITKIKSDVYNDIIVDGVIIFYCTKCLDVRKEVIE